MTAASQTPRPIALWRIVAQALWASAWLAVAAWFAAQPYIVLRIAALLPLAYGLAACSAAWRMWRRRQAVRARLANPRAPKFSLRFTTAPILHSLFYAAACALIALVAARKLLLALLQQETELAHHLLFVVIPTATAAVIFARGVLRARRCTYHADRDTFEISRLHGFSWQTVHHCRAAEFNGIQRVIRTNSKSGGEKLWLAGSGRRVLLGEADAVRSGSPMRDLAADIFAASGLPILPDSFKRSDSD